MALRRLTACNAGLLYFVIRERRKNPENKDPEAEEQSSPLATLENPSPEHLDEERLQTPSPTSNKGPGRQPSTAVEPIPEGASTEIQSSPDSPRRLSQNLNEPFIVQKNSKTDSAPISPVATPHEPTPATSRKPSEVLPREPTSPPSRRPSIVGSREPTPASSLKSSGISAREQRPVDPVSPQPSEGPSVQPPSEPTPPPNVSTPPQEPTPPPEPPIRRTATHSPTADIEPESESPKSSATMPLEVPQPASRQTGWLDGLQNKAIEAEPHSPLRTPTSPAPIVEAHTDDGQPSAEINV